VSDQIAIPTTEIGLLQCWPIYI